MYVKTPAQAHEYIHDAHTARLVIPAGVVAHSFSVIAQLDACAPLGIITTKSIQVRVTSGNREPVIVEPSEGNFGNSVGLRNRGLVQMQRSLHAFRSTHAMRALLLVSLAGSSIDEFCTLITGLDAYADAFELNVSCPHAEPGYGSAIGSDAHLLATYVRTLRAYTARPLFVKLTPNVADIASIARAAIHAGADGITAINTVGPQRYIEPHSGAALLNNAHGGKGGQSGQWIHDIALQKVAEVRMALETQVPIIGVGGVATRAQARAMHAAGATFIGIGSALAQVKQENFSRYFTQIAAALQQHTDEAAEEEPLARRTTQRQMAYHPLTVTAVSRDETSVYVRTSGQLSCAPGSVIFVWLPGVGEKPFFVSDTEPLSIYCVARGVLSTALYAVRINDVLYYRGPYADAPLVSASPISVLRLFVSAWYVALVPMFMRYCTAHKLGFTLYSDAPLPASMRAAHDGIFVHEASLTACIDAQHADTESALYIAASRTVLKRAYAQAAQCDTADTWYVASPSMLCGVGLCGECAVSGTLCCGTSTIVPLADALQREQ